MTLFEYLSVAISVILSLSAAQLFTNLRSVFDPSRRYWIHAVYVAQMLFLHLMNWWGFWGYRQLESWNLGSFSLVLLAPALMFVCSSALVAAPELPGNSWEQHFERIRKWFFVLRILLLVQALTREWLLLDRAALGLSRLGETTLMLLFITGIVSANRHVQATIAIVSSILIFVGLASMRFQASAL